MSGTLLEQLKKAGLVDNKKARQIKKEKHQLLKQGKKTGTVTNQASRLADVAAERKKTRDRELNQARQQRLAMNAEQAALRQQIEANCLHDWKGEVPYHVTVDAKIRTLHVKSDVHEQLTSGVLRIGLLDEAFVLLPAVAAAKIKQRGGDLLIEISNAEESLSMEDQAYYARFEIPDDLIW